jgi:hypothetical protein
MGEGGCTNCGNKGGCDSRKGTMFAAIDDALARLYPTRRWGERDDAVALEEGVGREEGEALTAAIARRMGTATLYRAGDPDEWCDYVYVLCMGRTPCIAQIRERLTTVAETRTVDGPGADDDDAGAAPAPAQYGDDAGDETQLEERYLRVALSSVVRLAGVQEVSMTLSRRGDDVVVTERARSGVFDPVLLPRFQTLVAVLAEAELRHLDFGEIVEAPEGFDPADYPERFGGAAPVIANYLFYPQPPTAVSTSVFPGAPGVPGPSEPGDRAAGVTSTSS